MNPYNQENLIILRSVFSKGGLKQPIKYYITPCKDPKTLRFPDHIRKVNSLGDMILSEEDRNNPYLIAEDRVFIIEDGATFNLDDPYSKAEWDAIKYCKLIAPDIYDKIGNKPAIDKNFHSTERTYNQLQSARYGVAELYIERPGQDTIRKVSKRKLKNQAENFIFNDSQEGLITKAKLMGRDMRYQPLSDIQDYLIEIGERDPNRIINLYTGEDMHLRLLLIDALHNKTIIIKNRLYTYADNIVLGASEDAVITWMKQPANAKVLDLIKKETHPEVYEITNEASRKAIEQIQKAKESKQKD